MLAKPVLSVTLKKSHFYIILHLSQMFLLHIFTSFEIMVSMRATARSLFFQFVKREHFNYITHFIIDTNVFLIGAFPCNLVCFAYWKASVCEEVQWLRCWRIHLQCGRPGFDQDPLEKGYDSNILGLPLDFSNSKESNCNVRDLGSIPGLGRSPAGGHGNPLQCSYLENPHGQRSLAG